MYKNKDIGIKGRLSILDPKRHLLDLVRYLHIDSITRTGSYRVQKPRASVMFFEIYSCILGQYVPTFSAKNRGLLYLI